LTKATDKTPAELTTGEITELTVTRTPEVVAAEICALKSQTQTIILHASVEIGRRLTEAKAMLAHGLWGKWLEVSVDYSQDTASRLMRIYEEYKNHLNSATYRNLTFSKAVALLGIPADSREQFAAENHIENMSTRELQKAIKEKEELEKQIKNAQESLAKKSEEARKNLEDKQRVEGDLRVTAEVLREKKELAEKLQKDLREERKDHKEKVEKLAESITETKRQLAEAQSAGNEALVEHLKESLEKTDNELHVALGKIEELEKKFREKPIETTAAEIIEKVPEEVERELAELRGKIVELEAKPEQVVNTAVLKYTVHFEQLVKGFGDILTLLDEIGKADQEAYGKYKKALSGLLGKMAERL